MAGLSRDGFRWMLVLLVAVLPASVVRGTYEMNKCYCYSDGYDDFLRGKIETLTNLPTLQAYEYVGVMPKANDVYEACTCNDVTRVKTVLKVTESSVVTDAADTTKHTALGEQITTKLNDLMQSMKSNTAALTHTLVSFSATLESATGTEALFDVEALLKGQDENLKDAVEEGLTLELTGNNFSGVGAVDVSSMTFSAVKCTVDPPVALTNGQRSWTSGNVASSEAVYTCDENFSLSSGNAKETSTCSHADLTWTTLPAGLECTPNPTSCAKNPPLAPFAASSNWNHYTKDEGTVVTYACNDGYTSEGNIKGVSKCVAGEWSPISSTFKCIQTGCIVPPPQVPIHGELSWNNGKADGTEISYTCAHGYKSSTGLNPIVTCTNMTWAGMPENWSCVSKSTKLDHESPTEEYEDEVNYVYIVTIPSVAGLVILIVCCLCCTRVDSPLFNICSTKGNLNSGYTAA